jgi:four helix bundle protein
MQDFKHIQAWQRAHALAVALHTLTRGFSRVGHAHLRAQITRAADSISANIVEGCGSSSTKDFARFLEISIKSANETEYHLLLARDLNLVSPEDWQQYTAETVEVRKMIYGYRRKVLSSA